MSQSRPLLVIGNRNYSSWSLRPWLVLRHFGVDFDTQVIPLDTARFQAEIGQFSPSRKVPVLRHGERVIWDSLAIVEYANETWLEGRAWPRDAHARASARAATAEMHSGFAALRSDCPMNLKLRTQTPDLPTTVQHDLHRIAQVWADLRTKHGAGGDFLCGEFSIVDACFAPVVTRIVSYGLTVDAGALPYLETMQQLPAMREWTQAALAETDSLDQYDQLAKR